MKLIDEMQAQRAKMYNDNLFRNNYRKKSMDPSKKQYRSSTFLMPAVSPSKTDLLGSSTAFRNLTASKRLINSSLRLSASGQKPVALPQFSSKSLRAATVLDKKPQTGMGRYDNQ